MKTISIVIPCYNEADCIKLVYNELNKIFSSQLSQYQIFHGSRIILGRNLYEAWISFRYHSDIQ